MDERYNICVGGIYGRKIQDRNARTLDWRRVSSYMWPRLSAWDFESSGKGDNAMKLVGIMHGGGYGRMSSDENRRTSLIPRGLIEVCPPLYCGYLLSSLSQKIKLQRR